MVVSIAGKGNESMDNVILEYVGNADGHGFYIEGVPACDLTQQMIDASGYTINELLAFSGPVYVPAVQQEGE